MIRKEGNKFILFSKDGKKQLGEFDTKEQAEEREAEINRIKHARKGDLHYIDLTITKATLQEDGTMRWQAVASDTDPDKTGESTSLPLFQDWIERSAGDKRVNWLPLPRQPFLGLSHYPDLDGLGEAGPTEKMYIDGDRFKASGVFYSDDEHPLGKALFGAIHQEKALIKKGQAPENPIRISAAWWDIAHSHGDFVFERKALTDKCPMCKAGTDSKVYLKGQLDHFAATRVPINPRTSLELTERAMTTRKKDAESIIDDPELVDEIDQKARLLGKSESEQELSEGMVVRGDEDEKDTLYVYDAEVTTGVKMIDTEDDDLDPDVLIDNTEKSDTDDSLEARNEMGDDDLIRHRPFGGAMTLEDAQNFIEAQERVDQVHSNWSMFRAVMQTALEFSEPDQIKNNIQDLLTEFSDRVAAIKAAIEDVALLDNGALTEPVVISQKGAATMDTSSTEQPVTEQVQVQHPAEVFRAEMDKILASNDLDREAKAKALQERFNTLGTAVKAELNTAAPQDVGEAVAKAFTPVLEKIDLMIAKMGQGYVQEVPPQHAPQQKSFVPVGPMNAQPAQPDPEQLPVSPVTGQPSAITALARRSVGIM